MASRWLMPTVAVMVFAMAIAYGSAEAEVEDFGVMEPLSPKTMSNNMRDVYSFIQEEVDVGEEKSATCDCQPAVTKAYSKFRGDMKKIEQLKEQSDTRANKAEGEAQKQAG